MHVQCQQKSLLQRSIKKLGEARRRSVKAGIQKYAKLCTDASVRLGELQEGKEVENGARTKGDIKPTVFAREVASSQKENETLAVHGRVCLWRYTFNPVSSRRINPATGKKRQKQREISTRLRME